MYWRLLSVFVISVNFAYAQITDSNVFDHLLVEKTKAQALVLSVKTAYQQDSLEYKNSKVKYAAAKIAFNNYTRAMIDSYRVGLPLNINQSAQTAASQAKEFADYIAGLDRSKSKGISAVFVATGMLIEIGNKIFTFLSKEQAARRDQIAEAMVRQLTWDDWDKIGM